MKARQAHQDEAARFDTDAKTIRIDNCASYYISNDIKRLHHASQEDQQKVEGIGWNTY